MSSEIQIKIIKFIYSNNSSIQHIIEKKSNMSLKSKLNIKMCLIKLSNRI